MSRLLILGATGSLGRQVLRQAVDAGHDVTVLVRTPSKLSPEVRERVSVHTGDLSALGPLDLARGQDALINCAGHVGGGDTFVGLIDRLVTSVDSLAIADSRSAGSWRVRRSSTSTRPAAAASSYRRKNPPTGRMRSTSSGCGDPALTGGCSVRGPMVEEPALGLDRLRISLDALPVQVSAFARALPGPLFLPVFASLIPQMIVSYADAAAVMLANLDRGNGMSRHRVGLALPVGMRGRSRSSRPKFNPETT